MSHIGEPKKDEPPQQAGSHVDESVVFHDSDDTRGVGATQGSITSALEYKIAVIECWHPLKKIQIDTKI